MTAEIISPSNTQIDKARTLSEALPYMQRYDRKCVVVKYGGHAMGDPDLARAFAQDIVMLKQSGVNILVVHGGGPQIGAMLEKLSIESEFKEGLRVTDQRTVEVVEMVLSGLINNEIVSLINDVGGRAVGLSGKDGNLLMARQVTRKIKDPDSNIERVVDLGLVGEPETVDRSILDTIMFSQFIPVIAPVASGSDGKTYNINSDTFAGAIAAALDAERFLLLTDVDGVLDKDKQLLQDIDEKKAQEMIGDGSISGGMIPKIETALKSLDDGVKGVVILNGKKPHAVLLELFTEGGAGTMIKSHDNDQI